MYVLVGEFLNVSFRKRLLHPGVNTADIITQYISAVKVCTHVHMDIYVSMILCYFSCIQE